MNTRTQIEQMVEELEKSVRDDTGDPEVWHGDQDAILETALQAIADGAREPQAIAKAALRVGEIEFVRWYA